MGSTMTKTKHPQALSTILQYLFPSIITALLGLIAGLMLSTYNANISDNRYFLEKRTIVADGIAKEFSTYVLNWGRLIQLRKQFDSKKTEPTDEEKENFKRVVFNRNDSRDRLFALFDSAHLYYGDDTSVMISEYRDWDIKQSTLKIDQLPDIKEWHDWQKNIIRKLHKEIAK